MSRGSCFRSPPAYFRTFFANESWAWDVRNAKLQAAFAAESNRCLNVKVYKVLVAVIDGELERQIHLPCCPIPLK